MVVFEGFRVVFELFEILELFEYLVAKYSIFEVELFLLELETLVAIENRNVQNKVEEVASFFTKLLRLSSNPHP